MSAPDLAAMAEPRLVDAAASCFESAGRALFRRSASRPGGTLALYRDRLEFSRDRTGVPVVIPLAEIRHLGMGRWHEPTGTFLPVLNVTYRGNLVLAIRVEQPQRWMEAIEDLAREGLLPSLRPGGERIRLGGRSLKAAVAVLLALALAVGALTGIVARLGPRGTPGPAGAAAGLPASP